MRVGTARQYLFTWVDEAAPVLGGQWMAVGRDGITRPVVLSDAVEAYRAGLVASDPMEVHVDAARRVIEAAGELEDELFPDAVTRLRTTLAAAETDASEVDPDSLAGERVRRGAEALEKLAADLAELVEEQLEGGSLAHLPPYSTHALCQAVQAAWRLRRLVDPPSPLYL